MGADVAAEPKGLAGEAVPMGLLTAAAEIVPGTDQAPWGGVRERGVGREDIPGRDRG